MVGYEQADDAGVYLLSEDTALVQTVDFFTPVVDDPFDFGQVAAANALSDIYAMGGEPRCALSIVCFPAKKLGGAILHEILRGGTSKMNEARVPVIGGHSVEDEEIKFGYAVTGLVNPREMYTNGTARAGDALLLTKPLGTGIVATGVKYGKASEETAAEALRWMLRLNNAGLAVLSRAGPPAVTDITGNGLLGHAYEMALSSGVTLVFDGGKIPTLNGARQLAALGLLPAGIEANSRYVGGEIEWNTADRFLRQVMFDPQTSGGLLIALPEEAVPAAAAALEPAGLLGQTVGRVVQHRGKLIEVWA